MNTVKELDNKEKIDDSKEIVTIDYYDRIHKQWIKLDVTKEVARLLKSEDQKTRRGNNRYNYYNLPFDEVFDSKNEENEKYLVDESSTIDFENAENLMDIELENKRTLIENSLCCLTPEQREVVEMAYYKNMSYSQIAEARGVNNKSSIYKIMKAAEKKIKKHINDTQN